MSFFWSPKSDGGRAYAILLWSTGLGFVAFAVVFVMAAWEGGAWLRILERGLGGFFVFLGIVAGGSQLPNAAERLPGRRSYHGTYNRPERGEHPPGYE
ncbi:MAG: hypothetical protein ACLFWG_00300 [Longimicrobiales bacterium]